VASPRSPAYKFVFSTLQLGVLGEPALPEFRGGVDILLKKAIIDT